VDKVPLDLGINSPTIGPCLAAQASALATQTSLQSSLWILRPARTRTSRIQIRGKTLPPSLLADSVAKRAALCGRRNYRLNNERQLLNEPQLFAGQRIEGQNSRRAGRLMTAEIVVANKSAIALAADSTITIRSAAGDKTFNTANKLFTIHKLYPVGALVYGSTTLNGIPIEVILKEYRNSLPDVEKPSLDEYVTGFLDFLRATVPVTASDHEENFKDIVQEYARRLQLGIRRAIVDRQINLSDAAAVRSVVREFIQDFRDRVNRAGLSTSLGGLDRTSLSVDYPNVVDTTVNNLFRLFGISAAVRNNIVNLVYDACLSNELTNNRMGIVIAGYGRNEYYPSLKSFETDGFFGGQLKLVERSSGAIRHMNESFVYPFAQGDVATLFMEGVDPLYQEYIEDQLRSSITGIADVAGRFFGSNDRRKIGHFRRALGNLATRIIDDFENRRGGWFISRTLDAIEFLDKSELAALAESLVSLTALRQKVSLDMETVGGPIDVAVISKGDGFIWIKRKYYFERDLNPFYFQRYLR
jgi:hypothetical protein